MILWLEQSTPTDLPDIERVPRITVPDHPGLRTEVESMQKAYAIEWRLI